MSKGVLIIGESGSGKSTSIRTLPPEQTFIINVIGKQLPFRGSQKSYRPFTATDLTGNYCCTDNHKKIMWALNYVSNSRPEIKYLIIDDFGYSLANEFMRKALEKGYTKFSEIGKDAFEVLDIVNNLREDLFCFVIMHSEVDNQGKSKPKTVGKMIDQYVNVEGKFTYVLHSVIVDGEYKFLTKNDGFFMAKTPLGMYEVGIMDNDLLALATTINEYLTEEVL